MAGIRRGAASHGVLVLDLISLLRKERWQISGAPCLKQGKHKGPPDGRPWKVISRGNLTKAESVQALSRHDTTPIVPFAAISCLLSEKMNTYIARDYTALPRDVNRKSTALDSSRPFGAGFCVDAYSHGLRRGLCSTAPEGAYGPCLAFPQVRQRPSVRHSDPFQPRRGESP